MKLSVVILAAGKGKRMRSALPKVLHKLGGISLLERVIATAQKLFPTNIYVVYGHEGELIKQQLENLPLTWIPQEEQLGTGHAVQQVLPHLASDSDHVLVLVGDCPLISTTTLQRLIDITHPNGIGILTTDLQDPTGFGRILQDSQGQVCGIVEEKDATAQQRNIKTINSGIMLFPKSFLQEFLPRLTAHNAQGEYYLTDLIALAVAHNYQVDAVAANCSEEVSGINDRCQLAILERYFQYEQARELMLQGVSLMDPKRFDLRGEFSCAGDVTIDVDVVLEGKINVGKNSYIGAFCHLRNVIIGDNVQILSHSVIEDAIIGSECNIGPFARIRPGTELDAGVRIGNFVEIKKAKVGTKTKINHLTYIGDAEIGKAVNIGAGTITCNYDGVNKYRTEIGDGAFIGSDTQLIAPVTIGAGAMIGAGSTITRDAPSHELTLSRSKQMTVPGWKKPEKKKVD